MRVGVDLRRQHRREQRRNNAVIGGGSLKVGLVSRGRNSMEIQCRFNADSVTRFWLLISSMVGLLGVVYRCRYAVPISEFERDSLSFRFECGAKWSASRRFR